MDKIIASLIAKLNAADTGVWKVYVEMHTAAHGWIGEAPEGEKRTVKAWAELWAKQDRTRASATVAQMLSLVGKVSEKGYDVNDISDTAHARQVIGQKASSSAPSAPSVPTVESISVLVHKMSTEDAKAAIKALAAEFGMKVV
jgi:hypothetical protein